MAALTTFKKELRKCPVCENQFKEEFMLTGSMRQVSININEELRTFYKKYNDLPVVPFAYETLTCPKCHFSSLIQDFNNLYPVKSSYTEKETEAIKQIKIAVLKSNQARLDMINSIGNINFNEERNLETSLASYILTVECYAFYNEKMIPDTKRAVCALRAAWIASDLGLKDFELKYYKEAHKFYTLILSKPDVSDGFKLGPDWGNNFGFEGARYVKAVLDLKFLDEVNGYKSKFEVLQNVRATFSKIRGLGKASQSKRGPLLTMAEDMFEKVQPIYDVVKAKVEKGIDDETGGAKLELKFTVKSAAETPAASEKEEEQEKDGQDAQAENPAEGDVQTKIKNAATEVVKYALKSGMRRDSIKDIEKILSKYFS